MSTRSSRSRSRPRRVVMLAFKDVQILDVTGPLEVFNIATQVLRSQGHRSGGYSTEVVAKEVGALRTSGNIEIVASCDLRIGGGSIDTLMVSGGLGTRTVVSDHDIIGWLRRNAPHARRVASVCTGALLLAEAGLLDGRRVTTHWRFADELARRYPKLNVDADCVYVGDGNVYTSAGVTAGMDLALALVEDDHGRRLALEVARALVLFLKRPGGQSQFSAQLASQLATREPIRDLQTWILENPGEDLSVEALAEHVAMSPRNFARVFAREVGLTPARFVERARIEAARRRLEDSPAAVEEVASECGFGSTETMRRAFMRSISVAPADYRRRFQRVQAR